MLATVDNLDPFKQSLSCERNLSIFVCPVPEHRWAGDLLARFRAGRTIMLLLKDIEVWRPILGYEGFYEVSNWGRVQSLDRGVWKFGYKMVLLRGGIKKPQDSTTGYLMVMLNRDAIHANFKIHRLVASAFLPNPECLPIVNHIDSDKHNNHVSNLEWCDYSSNIRHAYAIGARQRLYGTKTWTAKIVDSDVLKIRKMAAEGMRPSQIAKIYCMLTPRSISSIIRRETWSHV